MNVIHLSAGRLFVLLLAYLLLLPAVRAAAVDFNGLPTGAIPGPPYDLTTQGYLLQFIPTPSADLPTILPANFSPTGTQSYGLCGHCYASSTYNFYKGDGSLFALLSIDLGMTGGYTTDQVTFIITGFLPGGGKVIRTEVVTKVQGVKTFTFGQTWASLSGVQIEADNTGIFGLWAISVTDNINVEAAGTVSNVGLQIGPGTVHPHHDGGAAAIGGLNDTIPVTVFGSSVANGDPADFYANEIDPATVRFGPALGAIDPASTPVLDDDVDDDGDLDAQFEFLTGDTGIACADNSATLAGETATGEAFAGTDTINTDCNAQCH